MTLSCKGPIASLLVKLLIMTLSQEFIIICCPRGGPLRALGILGTVGKINALFEVTL